MQKLLVLVVVVGTIITFSERVGQADPNLPLLQMPVCGDQDGSEVPLVLNCPDFVPLPDVQTFQVPGPGAVEVRFDFVFEDASLNNEFGFFVADDATGLIGELRPGNPGYLAAAFARAEVMFPNGSTSFTPDVTLPFNGGDILVFFIVQGDTLANLLANNPDNELDKLPLAFFSLDRLNPDGVDHFVGFKSTGGDFTQLSFEDLTGGEDRDYDDAVYNIVPPLVPSLCGINEDGAFNASDVIGFFFRCRIDTASWVCDLDHDGAFNTSDIIALVRLCRPNRTAEEATGLAHDAIAKAAKGAGRRAIPEAETFPAPRPRLR